VTVRVLTSPHTGGTPLPVTVSTSDGAVVTATATAIQPGEQTTTLTVDAQADGTAVLTLAVGDVFRSVNVIVGTPSADQVPVTIAPLVGISVPAPASSGRVVVAPGNPIVATLGVQVFTVPRGTNVTGTITTSDPAVVGLSGGTTSPLFVGAGQTVASVTISTTGATGAAVLSIDIDGQRSDMLVIVGDPPLSVLPAIVSPVVGVRIQ
jgi:hypothetical protein